MGSFQLLHAASSSPKAREDGRRLRVQGQPGLVDLVPLFPQYGHWRSWSTPRLGARRIGTGNCMCARSCTHTIPQSVRSRGEVGELASVTCTAPVTSTGVREESAVGRVGSEAQLYPSVLRDLGPTTAPL